MKIKLLRSEQNVLSCLRRCFVVILMSCLALNVSAQTETTDSIVSTDTIESPLGDVHRIVFHYTTIDKNGETPIVLSAAIFMNEELYNKEEEALGMMLLSHYTITDNPESPTSIDKISLEVVFSPLSFIIVEPDGIGFGLTIDEVQPYLYGELTAKQNIDALIAAKELLSAEGYSFGDKLVTTGYSQGGHSTMWINKVIAEGYRNDEVSHIDYSLPGGGPYDIVGIYRKLVVEDTCQYPVALPLICYSYAIDNDLKFEDILVPELIEKIPEWFDSKKCNSGSLNDSIYNLIGGRKGIATSKVVTAQIMDSTSQTMQILLPEFRKNSLVYDDWYPSATDSIYFFHSLEDEVVPYLCVENMMSFLDSQDYGNYKLYNGASTTHTSWGTMYALTVVAELALFSEKTTGIKEINLEERIAKFNPEAIVTVYNMGSQAVKRGVKMKDALNGLPRGVYLINGLKFIVP